MCEILVRAVDGTGVYETEGPKRGHIVCVQKDGHEWGRLECPPEYFIVKIPGVAQNTIQQYCNVYYDPSKVLPTILYRRRWVINESRMSLIQAEGGIVTINLANFNSSLTDRLA